MAYTTLTIVRNNVLPTQLNFRMSRGDTFQYQFQVVDKEAGGAVVNLTGGKLYYTAKYGAFDTDASAIFQLTSPASGIVIDDATNGKATLTISPANTSGLAAHRLDLPHDIQYKDSTAKIFTILRGQLLVLPDVSVSTV